MRANAEDGEGLGRFWQGRYKGRIEELGLQAVAKIAAA